MTRSLASVCLLVLASASSGCATNLAWIGAKTYDPAPSASLVVDGFGINATVDVLAPGAQDVTISRRITNTSTVGVSAGSYEVQERVVRWKFEAGSGGATWTEGVGPQYVFFEASQPGPKLAPGESATVQFRVHLQGPAPTGVSAPLCGLYCETLTIDPQGALSETDKKDNVGQHFFFRLNTGSCGSNYDERGSGGRNAATIFSLRYSSSL